MQAPQTRLQYLFVLYEGWARPFCPSIHAGLINVGAAVAYGWHRISNCFAQRELLWRGCRWSFVRLKQVMLFGNQQRLTMARDAKRGVTQSLLQTLQTTFASFSAMPSHNIFIARTRASNTSHACEQAANFRGGRRTICIWRGMQKGSHATLSQCDVDSTIQPLAKHRAACPLPIQVCSHQWATTKQNIQALASRRAARRGTSP